MNFSTLRHSLEKLQLFALRRNKLVLGVSFAVVVIVLAALTLHTGYAQKASPSVVQAAPPPVVPLNIAPTDFPIWTGGPDGPDGIVRKALLHTAIGAKPPKTIIQYTVLPGDTIFGIADKFGLQPSTILLANMNVLGDNPHMISPKQVLDILPMDGGTYVWHADDGLNKVADYFKVKPEDIVNYPGNHLDPATLGDYAHPNIKPGTLLIIPGGHREFIIWSAPQISRKDPAVARLYGPGACGKVAVGAVGTGSFVWPTVEHWLSGFDYDPSANHPAIDIAGRLGNAIYAADSGVVVYAGWNNFGYGNVIVVDHGDNWQTLYAHLSELKVGCGDSVFRGNVIGLMGSTGHSTGPHLHFEMMIGTTHVNPHQYLPAP